MLNKLIALIGQTLGVLTPYHVADIIETGCIRERFTQPKVYAFGTTNPEAEHKAILAYLAELHEAKVYNHQRWQAGKAGCRGEREIAAFIDYGMTPAELAAECAETERQDLIDESEYQHCGMTPAELAAEQLHYELEAQDTMKQQQEEV